MISKITESNKELIKARLKEISMALDGNEDSISTLESYYANITRIAPLATNFHSAPYKYFLMPTDEPVFEIDANKRLITVPQHFAKNGVGVHGDHMAEILYFRIDRYFDYQDLMSVDAIVINWQFKPSNASRNAEIETHTSYALAPDETYDPGHIMFGWVLGNFVETDDQGIEHQHFMTPSKGKIDFSISFLKRVGKDYKYVLNTLIASVNINDSITLDDPTKLDDIKHPVFECLRDSEYTPEGVTPLEDPVFRTNPVESMVDGQRVIEYKGLPRMMNFQLNADGSEEENLILQTIGYAPDDGIIKYRWLGTTTTGDSIDRQADTLTTIGDYVVTSDLVKNPHITYYVLVDNEMKTLAEAELEDADFTELVQHQDVFELGSHLDVTTAGEYQVEMQSIKNVTGVAETIKSGSVQSQTCSVPVAAVPSVDLIVEGAMTPEIAAADDEIADYSIYDADLASKYTFINSDAPIVKAIIGIDPEKMYNIETGEGIRGFNAYSEIGAIALKMTEAEELTAEEIAELKSPESAGDYKIPTDDGLIVEDNTATGEGIYKVFAINRRNHTYNISKASEAIDVKTIAPVLSDCINVTAQEGTEYSINLISGNVAIPDAKVELNANYHTRNFHISIDSIKEGVSLQLRAVEIDQDAYAQGRIEYLPAAEDGDSEYPTSYMAKEFDDEMAENYSFAITEDQGLFVIEATTRYFGTQRVTVTDPFRVTSTL